MQSSAFFKIAHKAHKRSKHCRNCPHKPVHIHIKAQQPKRGAEACKTRACRGGLQLPELQNNEDDGGGGEWDWNVVLIWGEGRWGWGVEEVGESVTKCGCVLERLFKAWRLGTRCWMFVA